MAAATTRWGILATGKIAHSFARDLLLVADAEIVHVGSRRPEAARSFAEEYGAEGCRAGSYDDLVADDDVDVVYVATPHALHLAHARLALEAGRHVLCEKPLALNAVEAEQMVALARQHDRFLMEAMWMACHPMVLRLREGLAAGEFGTPRQVHADLGFRVDRPPDDRLLDPGLGGGALLDMGVYPLTFADLLLGPARRLTAAAVVDESGIDLDVAIAGEYDGGAVAALTASMTSPSPRTATVATSTGRLDVAADFHHPTAVTWTPAGGDPVEVVPTGELIGAGYGNEAVEVHRCLSEGLRESPLVPHEQTLRLMRQMDDLRRQIGVRYPGEQ